jgi:hypothetical protein
MSIPAIIQEKRDTAANWTSNNPTLVAGRICVESDTRRFKIGTGAAWASTPYAGEFFDGLFTEAAAPATPATGKVILYAKVDGLLYSKDDAGTETLVSGGAGGGGGSGGTKTYAVFTIRDWQPPASGFATFDTRNSIGSYKFAPSVLSSLFAVNIMPEGASLGSGLKVRIKWKATTATSGNVRWRVEFENMDATDLDSDSFDTAVEASGTANGTSGITTTTEITVTTIDSITAGTLYRLKISRVGTDGANDTMTTSAAELEAVEVRSAA